MYVIYLIAMVFWSRDSQPVGREVFSGDRHSYFKLAIFSIYLF